MRPSSALAAILIASTALIGPVALISGPYAQAAATVVEWRLDSLQSVGGHRTQVVGAPRIVDTEVGKAIQFDGVRDGLIVEANPLEGMARFTLEVLLQPDVDGGDEQRFFHIESGGPGTSVTGNGNRALMELRLTAGKWALDTYLRHDAVGVTLLDRARTHSAGAWHAAALVYDGRTMRHYVDGQLDGAGEVAFPPLGPGRASIGVRQNLVSYFKGRIARVRVTGEALPAGALLRTAP